MDEQLTEPQPAPSVEVRELPGGTTEISVDLRALERPANAFYANAAAVTCRTGLVAMTFGQLRDCNSTVLNGWLCIELPASSARALLNSVRHFRDTLDRAAEQFGTAPEYPEQYDPTLPGIVYPASLIRCSLAVNLGSFEFYAIFPNPSGPKPEMVPMIRVDMYASVMKLVIDACEGVVRVLDEGGAR